MCGQIWSCWQRRGTVAEKKNIETPRQPAGVLEILQGVRISQQMPELLQSRGCLHYPRTPTNIYSGKDTELAPTIHRQQVSLNSIVVPLDHQVCPSFHFMNGI